jgi:hypothetical protein
MMRKRGGNVFNRYVVDVTRGSFEVTPIENLQEVIAASGASLNQESVSVEWEAKDRHRRS